MSTRKTALTLTSLAVALIFAGGVYLLVNLDAIAQRMAQRIASQTLGVDVGIGMVDITLKDKTVVVKNITVGNPPGYRGRYAARIDTIRMKADTLSDVLLRFGDINVSGTEVFLEVQQDGTNLSDIKNNVNAKAAKGDKAAQQIKVIIEQMRIEKMQVIPTVLLVNNQELDPIVIPDIVLRGIGEKENGVLARDAVGQIWADIARRATQSASQAGYFQGMSDEALKDIGVTQVQKMKEQISHDVDKLGKDLKRIFSE